MCLEDVIDIHVPKRDDNSRLMGPPIIKLEFDRDTLDPRIVIRRVNFQLRMKKEKGAYSLDTQKNTTEAKSSAGGAQNRFKRRENTVSVDYCASIARNPTGHEIKTPVENTKRKHQFRTK